MSYKCKILYLAIFNPILKTVLQIYIISLFKNIFVQRKKE